MQLNILEIAQKLINELLAEEQNHRQRAEGVAMLFHRIQDAHAALQQAEAPTVETETTNVEG